MPRADWDIDTQDIDDWDRESQYVPYTGPTPPNAVYQWLVKIARYMPVSEDGKRPQLSLGLELVSRSADEDRYAGYFCWKNAYPSKKNQWTWVPFLDAIGVSSTDFVKRTITDDEGNIKRIGKWANDADTEVLGQLEDNVYEKNGTTVNGKTVGWIGVAEDIQDDDDDAFDDEDEYVDDAD